MNKQIELLAPGGDVEAIKAAIVGGANAVYCGLDMFNARNRASNLLCGISTAPLFSVGLQTSNKLDSPFGFLCFMASLILF